MLIYRPGVLRAMAVRQKKAGGGPAGAGGGESPYTELEEVLKKVYKAVKRGYAPGKPASIELGGLVAKVYAEAYRSGIVELEEYRVIFEVRSRGGGGEQHPLCRVQLEFEDGELHEFEVGCWELKDLASKCARGGGCALSWEEMEDALGLTVWAANRLAKLAGIPAKVKRASLVEARGTWDGEVNVFPCLQMSIDGKSYSMCREVRLSSDLGGRWWVDSGLRLVPIGETHAKMVEALMELKEVVPEHARKQESEGAKYIYVRKHRGEFLELEEVVLRRPDGAEEVLLKPRFPRPYYLGEGLAVVECFYSCSEGSDSELADAFKKELEEAWGEVVQAVRRYTEEQDPQYAVFAYIALEALRRAGLAPA